MATNEIEVLRRQNAELLATLREAATKATPGPWKAIEWTCHAPTTIRAGAVGITVADTTGHGRHSEACAVDAAYIAAANPSAILSLLEYIALLEAKMAASAPGGQNG
jgi:hypothetical protein